LTKFSNLERGFIQAFNSIEIKNANEAQIGDQIIIGMQYMGLVNIPTQTELKFLIKYIQNNYGVFNLNEIGLAFEMAASGKIDCEKHFQNFSPAYFSSVMNAYRVKAAEIRRKIEPEETKETPYLKVTDEEIIETVLDYWENSQVRRIEFINPKAYSILRKEGKINLSEDEKEKIRKQVKKNLKDENSDYIKDDVYIDLLCKKTAVAQYINKLIND